MATYICMKCNKSYKTFTEHKRHINKKIDCTTKNKYNTKCVCEYCNKTYYNKYTLITHQTKCKSKKTQDNIIIENKIKKMEEQIQELITHKETKNKINVYNNNTINIQILPFGKTNNYLTDTQISKILSKGYKSIEEYIKVLHFDIAHPENHNIYISNNRDKHVNVFDGENWKLEEKNDIVERLYTDNTDFLIGKFTQLLEYLDKITINKFSKLKSDYESDEDLENIKSNIKLLLYNNRKIIEDTKKITQN